MKVLLNTVLLGAALAFAAHPAMAETPKKETPKKVVKKSTKKSAQQQAAKSSADDDYDVAKSTAVEMECALGDKVTLYQNAEDNQHIGMRWKKQLVRMDQVQTTTGAQRYESTKHGMVWIGIPAKGMLLDSKKGQQLANECRTKEQIVAAKTQPAPQPQIFQEASK